MGALVAEVLPANLSEADLTLQVDLHTLHAKVQLLHVGRQSLIEEAGLVLAQGQADEQLGEIQGLVLYEDVEDGVEVCALQVHVVDEQGELLDQGHLQLLLKHIINDVLVCIILGLHQDVRLGYQTVGQDVVDVPIFDDFNNLLYVLLLNECAVEDIVGFQAHKKLCKGLVGETLGEGLEVADVLAALFVDCDQDIVEYQALRYAPLILEVVANLDFLPLIVHVNILVVVLPLNLAFDSPDEFDFRLELEDGLDIEMAGIQEICGC